MLYFAEGKTSNLFLLLSFTFLSLAIFKKKNGISVDIHEITQPAQSSICFTFMERYEREVAGR